MCGIVGIIDFQNKDVCRKTLFNMGDAIVSRGPDDDGYFFSDFVGLGHKRLSIIDLETGHQPIASSDKRYTLVFNGEIYNYLEIKQRLQKQGHVFKTASDAEVLLTLFALKGAACLDELNGMFAFAVWDEKNKSLFLARDRMGKKPLYYFQTKGVFVFGSELKALLKNPLIEKDVDPLALKNFFTYEYVPAPLSIIKNVNKLQQASFLTVNRHSVSLKRYWSPPAGSTSKDSFEQASRNVYNLLNNAVSSRLISDVPLGVFLSGGIDSSAIVSMMANHYHTKDIKTFAVNFEEKSYDESRHSSLVAKHFQTDHYEETLSAKKMLTILPDVMGYVDEPFADPSILPTYLLSRFTKNQVTVALGGDGGDELFAGYPTFFANRLANEIQRLPGFVKRSLNAIAKALPVSNKNMSFDFKLRQFLMGLDYDGVFRHQVWLSGISPLGQQRLFHPAFSQNAKETNAFHLITEEMKRCPSSCLDDQLLYFYQKFYLCDDILTKVDRSSMAHSLEVRAPFLDINLVNYVTSLPYHYKLRGLTTKRILKAAMAKHLPSKIITRPKKGFGIPVAGWLKKELKQPLLLTLNKERIQKEGYFNWDYVNELITQHCSNKKNNRKPLFSLLAFHWWADHHLNS